MNVQKNQAPQSEGYDNEPLILDESYLRRVGYRFCKRAFDILMSAVAILVLLIPFLIIAIAVKADSKGPVIFKQQRIGRKRKPFLCYKFRSMSTSAPHDCATDRLDNAESYITKVGAFLRKTSLDELPQFFNVLRGDMSLVGPRPCVLTEKKLAQLRNQNAVFTVRPGVTGFAQVNGRDLVTYQEKAAMDGDYVKRASIRTDLGILRKTFGVVFHHTGVREGKRE